MTSPRANTAEAFLFSEGGSLTKRKLAQLLGIKETQLPDTLAELSAHLQGGGLCVVETEKEVSLAVAPESSSAVRAARENELGREIGAAGLEVLSIVLYRGPSTRAQIDYIRGVNTASTVRTLLSRGLLERIGNPEDGREFLYRPTVELLAHLGVHRTSELPDHARIAQELTTFEEQLEVTEKDHAGDATE